MSTLYGLEDFEHSGSAPSNWIMTAGWAAGTTQAKSGTYEWAQTSNNTTNIAGPNATDSTLGSATPGDHRVSVWIYLTSANLSGYIGVYLRMSILGFSATCYRFDMVSGSQACNIQKGSSGSYSVLASRTSSFAAGWYQAIATANGTALSFQIQRGSDSLWMQTDGSWGSSQVACLSTTDSTILHGSAAYCGVVYYGTGSGGAGIDLFQLDDMNSPTTVSGTAAMSGASLLSATGTAIVLATGAIVSISSLSAAAQAIVNGSAAMTGAGLLTPAGLVISQATAAMIGAGSLNATPGGVTPAQAAMLSVGALQANGTVITIGQAACVGSSQLNATTGPVVIQGAAHMIGCALETALGRGPRVPLLVLRKRARRL